MGLVLVGFGVMAAPVGAGIKNGGDPAPTTTTSTTTTTFPFVYNQNVCVLEYEDGEVIDSVAGDCPSEWLSHPLLVRVWGEVISEGDVTINVDHVVIARQPTTTTSTTTTTTQPTTSTTAPATTTTRSFRATTTTTTGPTTTQPPPTTSPTVLGTEVVASTQPAPTTTAAVLGGELPRTGPETGWALLFGGVALVLGGLLLLASEWLPVPARARGARGRRR